MIHSKLSFVHLHTHVGVTGASPQGMKGGGGGGGGGGAEGWGIRRPKLESLMTCMCHRAGPALLQGQASA